MNVNQFLLDTFKQAVRGKSGCLFCAPYEGMIMKETDNFRVLIDTFPIASGHLMMSSKSHYGCCGEIPHSIFDELLQIKNELRERYADMGKATVFYEHGRAGCCVSKDPNYKCEHLHLHCLPVDISIQRELSARYQPVPMKEFEEITALFLQNGDYLYFEDTFNNKIFYPVMNSKVESHLLRTLICFALKRPEFSKWEEFTDADLFIRSFDLAKYVIEDKHVCNLFG